MADGAVQLVGSVVVTATGAWLVIRLVTYIRGRRPAVSPRVLSFFELRREPVPIRRLGLSFDVWVVGAILVACEVAAAEFLFDAIGAGSVTLAALWVAHFVALFGWTGYLWRSRE